MHYRSPSLETLAVFANRWLKAHCPAHAHRPELLHLLARCQGGPPPPPGQATANPRPSLGLPDLVHQAKTLWQQALGTNAPQRLTPSVKGGDLDRAITLVWLGQQLGQCQPAYWHAALVQDGHTHGPSLHPLGTLLPDSATTAGDLTPFGQALWALYVEQPFGWQALLHQLETTLPLWQTRWPYLAQLPPVMAYLSQVSVPQSEASAVDWLRWAADTMPKSVEQGLSPVRLVVLVEGISDAALLPALALCDGLDLAAAGVHIQSIGGKNKVATSYAHWSPWLRPRMVLLLDGDAYDEWHPWAQRTLRPGDDCYFWPAGELEDEYPLDWMVAIAQEVAGNDRPLDRQTIASYFDPQQGSVRQAVQLAHCWQQHQLGAFDKARFAQGLAQWLQANRPPLSASLQRAIAVIRKGLALAPTMNEVWPDVVAL